MLSQVNIPQRWFQLPDWSRGPKPFWATHVHAIVPVPRCGKIMLSVTP